MPSPILRRAGVAECRPCLVTVKGHLEMEEGVANK